MEEGTSSFRGGTIAMMMKPFAIEYKVGFETFIDREV